MFRRGLVRFAVFAFGGVVEDVEVGGVAGLGDVVAFKGGEDGAAGLVGVGAVVEAAVARDGEEFGEVVCYFILVEIDGAEAADARGVDDLTAGGEVEQLAEGGGVHAGVVHGRDFGGAQIEPWDEAVDQCGFANAGVARHQSDFAVEHGLQLVHADAFGGGYGHGFVADALVEILHAVEQFAVVLIEDVDLVDGQDGRHVVGFGGGEKAVDKGGGGGGVRQGHDQESLVDVGSDDVRLLRQVAGAADDVVATRHDGSDERSAIVGRKTDFHAVAHSHGVGGADAFDAEVTLDFAIHFAAAIEADHVVRTGVSDY